MTASVRPTVAFVNVGHTFAHLFMLLYPTVVLALKGSWGLGYAELLPLGAAGYFLFGVGALPAGWLADRWNGARLMVMLFVGTGAASILTGLALGPCLQSSPRNSTLPAALRQAAAKGHEGCHRR